MKRSRSLTPRIESLEAKQLMSVAPLSAPAAMVTTLYKDILGRAPDPAGLTGWVNYVNAGASIAQISSCFWNCPEHKANPIGNLTSAISDADNVFVNALYHNVLGRSGDTPGIAFWDSILNNNLLTPIQVTEYFVNSPEHQAQLGVLPVAPPIQHPTSYGEYQVIAGSSVRNRLDPKSSRCTSRLHGRLLVRCISC